VQFTLGNDMRYACALVNSRVQGDGYDSFHLFSSLLRPESGFSESLADETPSISPDSTSSHSSKRFLPREPRSSTKFYDEQQRTEDDSLATNGCTPIRRMKLRTVPAKQKAVLSWKNSILAIPYLWKKGGIKIWC
jgi:hypothetical protein